MPAIAVGSMDMSALQCTTATPPCTPHAYAPTPTPTPTAAKITTKAVPNTTTPAGMASQVKLERELRDAATEGGVSAGGEGGEAGKKQKAEANLIMRLDKLFARHFRSIKAMMENERQDREAAERKRLEMLLRSISDTINTVIPERVEKAVNEAIRRDLPHATALALRSSTPAMVDGVSQSVCKAVKQTLANPQVAKSIGPRSEAVAADVTGALKQPMQEAFRDHFQSMLLPAFEAGTRAMFQQIHGSFEAQFLKHKEADSRAKETSEQLQSSLEDIKHSLDKLAQISKSLAGGLGSVQKQQKVNTAKLEGLQSLTESVSQLHEHVMALKEQGVRVTEEKEEEEEQNTFTRIQGMIEEKQFNDAFILALQQQSLDLVVWLCSQLHPIGLFTGQQGGQPVVATVVLSLAQQLAFDLTSDTNLKIAWLRETLKYLESNSDATIGPHIPTVLDQVGVYTLCHWPYSPHQPATALYSRSHKPFLSIGRRVCREVRQFRGSGSGAPCHADQCRHQVKCSTRKHTHTALFYSCPFCRDIFNLCACDCCCVQVHLDLDKACYCGQQVTTIILVVSPKGSQKHANFWASVCRCICSSNMCHLHASPESNRKLGDKRGRGEEGGGEVYKSGFMLLVAWDQLL